MIWNKHFKWSIFWLLVNLTISASSIAWLSLMVQDTSEFSFYMGGAGLLASLILPIVPGALAAKYRREAEFEATKQYIDKFANSYKDAPELVLDKSFRSQQEPWLIAEGRGVLKNAHEIIYGTIYGVSSLLLDATMMTAIVDPWFSLAYLGSAIAFTGTVFLSKRKIKELSKSSMEAEINLTDTMTSGWNNIVIGNKNNFDLWHQKYQNIFSNARELTVKHFLWIKLSGSFGTIAAILPILATTSVLFYFYKQAGNVSQIALLFTIIPRQLQTIQYFKDLSNTLTERSGVQERIKDLNATVEDPFNSKTSVNYNIKWSKLIFSKNRNYFVPNSVEDFLLSIEKMETGRITIRGENMAGKSVLLYKLNDYLLSKGLKTFFLPTGLNLAFNPSVDTMSTGERLLAILGIIQGELTEEAVILLDEWDANLDLANMAQASSLIERLSTTKCVIEARHRTEELNIQGVTRRDEDSVGIGSSSENDVNQLVLFNYNNRKKVAVLQRKLTEQTPLLSGGAAAYEV